jgi:nucleolar protein 15
MSSTVLKKAKRLAKTKTNQSLAELDATPATLLKGRKPKVTKVVEEHVHKTKSKLVPGEATKRAERPRVTTAEETRRNTVANTRSHASRATRLERKPRGPWRAPSPSPSLSPTSDLEPSPSEEDEPEVPQEEGSAGEENVHLYGFSTDEDSSDDDLDVVDEEATLDMGTLPTVARDDAAVKRKLERAKRKPVRVSFSLPPAAKH